MGVSALRTVPLLSYLFINVRCPMHLYGKCSTTITAPSHNWHSLPGRVQVIYSTTSLWSSLATMVMLSQETRGVAGWVGGSVIALAGLLAGMQRAEGGGGHGSKGGEGGGSDKGGRG